MKRLFRYHWSNWLLAMTIGGLNVLFTERLWQGTLLSVLGGALLILMTINQIRMDENARVESSS